MDNVLGFWIAIMWLWGIVLAEGWLTLVAIFFPFYAWYLVVESIVT